MTTYHARLLYNSGVAQTRADLRGGDAGNRTLLFDSKVIGVDMVVFPDASGRSYVIHGQVRRRPSDDPAVDVKVRLGSQGDTSTRTDAHGQFSALLPVSEQPFVITVVDDGSEDGIEVVCAVPGEASEQES